MVSKPMECDTETMNELNMLTLGAVTQYIFPRAPPGGNSLGRANRGV